MRMWDREEVRVRKSEVDRSCVPPNMGTSGSHPQATSRPERGKHWDVKCVKENVRGSMREEQVEKEAQEEREWQGGNNKRGRKAQ